MGVRERKKSVGNFVVTEVLVKLHSTQDEDATYKFLHTLQRQYPHLVSKVLGQGRCNEPKCCNIYFQLSTTNCWNGYCMQEPGYITISWLVS